MGFINKLDKQYQDLLQDILDNGTPKSDRTGTGTISVFGRQIRHKMSEGFPLLTTKKMPWKSIVTELLWFLQGNTNIKWLVDNGGYVHPKVIYTLLILFTVYLYLVYILFLMMILLTIKSKILKIFLSSYYDYYY
jgi:hypothetical protein